MENNSGQGAAATVPAEIDRWSWGAFLLNWIWGIGNNTFVALLMFVPLVNFVMPFVLGAKGSSWAWRNKRWQSVEEFRSVQRSWAKWGVIVWLAFIAVLIGIVFAMSAAFKSSEAYKLAVARLESSEQAGQMIGRPFSTGMPDGKIDLSGSKGSASLSFSVEGPNGRGTVHVEASKDAGSWTIQQMQLEQEGTGRRVDLTK